MKYVALLRGIGPTNPNMHNDRLRALFEEGGLQNVQTVIASGNVIFETDRKNIKALETELETALPTRLGFSSTVIIRSWKQLRGLINSNPFQGQIDSPTSRFNVTFLKKGGEVPSVIDTVNIGTVKIMAELEKRYGKEITTRTWKTVIRIMEKMDKGDAF